LLCGDAFGGEVSLGGGQEYYDIDRLDGKSPLDISPEDGRRPTPATPTCSRASSIRLHRGIRWAYHLDLAAGGADHPQRGDHAVPRAPPGRGQQRERQRRRDQLGRARQPQ
jgi:hypothetical protein